MANIPIQKKSKVPWWAWLIGLITVGLLIWLLLDVILDDDEDDAEIAQPTATTQAPAVPAVPDPVTSPSATMPLTDVTVLATAIDPTLTGRTAQLEGAEVLSVVGDRTFWIGPSAEDKILVVLDEAVDPAGAEGLVNVNEGQQVSLTADVRKIPPMPEARETFDLNEQEAAELDGEVIYLYADTVTVQS